VSVIVRHGASKVIDVSWGVLASLVVLFVLAMMTSSSSPTSD
jgi:hypothetical protein